MTHSPHQSDSARPVPRPPRGAARRLTIVAVVALAAWGVLQTPIFDWLTLRMASAHEARPSTAVVGDGLILDDAGRTCRPSELMTVELRVETDLNELVGHVFIHTPNLDRGFYPTVDGLGATDYLNPLSPTAPGRLKDNRGHAYDRVRTYRVSPQTLRLLESAIQGHASDSYQLGNWSGGRNCATWATDRLRDVGLDAPPGDRPNVMAAYMRPAGGDAR